MHALQVQFQINTKKEVKIKAVYEKGRDERERERWVLIPLRRRRWYPSEGKCDFRILTKRKTKCIIYPYGEHLLT